jgi:hypothetical protein
MQSSSRMKLWLRSKRRSRRRIRINLIPYANIWKIIVKEKSDYLLLHFYITDFIHWYIFTPLKENNCLEWGGIPHTNCVSKVIKSFLPFLFLLASTCFLPGQIFVLDVLDGVMKSYELFFLGYKNELPFFVFLVACCVPSFPDQVSSILPPGTASWIPTVPYS